MSYSVLIALLFVFSMALSGCDSNTPSLPNSDTESATVQTGGSGDGFDVGDFALGALAGHALTNMMSGQSGGQRPVQHVTNVTKVTKVTKVVQEPKPKVKPKPTPKVKTAPKVKTSSYKSSYKSSYRSSPSRSFSSGRR
jgi:hypothetical protein